MSGGLCRCGCGQATRIAKKTSARAGTRKGKPVDYISGHRPIIRREITISCEKCGQSRVTRSSLARLCVRCLSAGRREQDRQKQKERRAKSGHREKYRAWCLQSKYGLTIEKFNDLLASQGGCAICHSQTPRWNKDWHVDHDHRTGAVRGILCSRCNVLIGFAGENAENLEGAAEYLRLHGAKTGMAA